jgi:hypothetical protein
MADEGPKLGSIEVWADVDIDAGLLDGSDAMVRFLSFRMGRLA